MKKSFFEICKQAKTDKVNCHGYHFFYPQFLEKLRDETFNMLEIGYGEGHSIEMWSEYFPNCNFFCMDINTEITYNDRCKVVKGDQSKKEDLQEIVKKIKKARLIVDDGSHNPKHQYETFVYLFEHLLEEGGTYIIEDVETSYWNPNAVLYGYRVGNFDLMKKMSYCKDMINYEFSKTENTLKIATITYAQNCIILTKRTKIEQEYFNRKYRFEFMTV